MGYLKADLAAEARARVAEMPEASKIVRIVRGQGRDVLNEIDQFRPAPEDAWRREADAYQAASALAWLGELDLARRACRIAGAGDYAQMAWAITESEAGLFEAALRRIDGLAPDTQSDFALSLFWRLVQQRRWEDAEKLVEGVRSAAARSNLLRLLAKTYHDRGENEKAAALAIRSFELALSSNAALTLRNLAEDGVEVGNPEQVEALLRVERVIHWTGLARQLESKETLRDLAAYLEKVRGGDFLAFTRAAIAAAGDWTSALQYTRGTEKWHGAKAA